MAPTGEEPESQSRSDGSRRTSPAAEESASRISFLKPEDTDTETIMTRKLSAMDITTILLRKRSFPEMNPVIPMNGKLPDYYPFLLRTVHLVAFLDTEGIEEGLEIPECDIDPVFPEGMHIQLGEPCLLLVPDVHRPYGGV